MPKVKQLGGKDSPWYEIKTDSFFAQIMRFDNPSHYGINKGRISKLFIRSRVVNFKFEDEIRYDRGWDRKIKKTDSKALKKFYNWIIKRFN